MGIKRQSPGKWQVFSETGVGAGYLLHTYTAGTTDDKLTHKNKEGSSDNTNPVVFDARGEADIWFDGIYDLKLTEADGTLIWTLADFGAGEGTVNYGNYNLLTNGGFEDDSNGDSSPDQWVITGAHTLDTTDQIEGANALKFTGTGTATSDFFEVREGGVIHLSWMMKASAAAITATVEVIWFTAAQVQISASSIYSDSSSNPISWTEKRGNTTPPSTARYAKLRLSTTLSAQTVLFDDVYVTSSMGNATITGILALSNAVNEKNGADIASSTTTDIGAATGNYLNITGTTTITGLGTIQAGTRRIVQFAGSLTLTYNATTLILPGNANVVTQAGDVAIFVSLGSGNWICVNYQRTAIPGTISNYAHGEIVYIESNTGVDTASFDIDAVIGSTFESVGPTGSGAANIWTAMDVIPTGAKWVEITIYNQSIDSTGAAIAQSVWGQKTGGGGSVSDATAISEVNINAAGSTAIQLRTRDRNIKIPLDSSLRFDLAFQNDGTLSDVKMYLNGFGL